MTRSEYLAFVATPTNTPHVDVEVHILEQLDVALASCNGALAAHHELSTCAEEVAYFLRLAQQSARRCLALAKQADDRRYGLAA